MAYKNRHPLYAIFLPIWEKANDSYLGEDTIKDKGEKYLPPAQSHRLDGYPTPGSVGTHAYDAYKLRAYYPDIYEEAVAAAVGIMHRKPPVITLPKAMEPMLERANRTGETLAGVLKNINTLQLISGRLGLLADIVVKDQENPTPVLVLYKDTTIVDWNDDTVNDDSTALSYVVLDESGYEMTPEMKWESVDRFLVLALVEGTEGSLKPSKQGLYAFATVKDDDEVLGAEFTVANYRANTLTEIPFSFINTADIIPNPSKPPLDGLANLCLAIYRGEADYRQNLFMQGQDTLVKIGSYDDKDEPTRVGSAAVINVPVGGDAKFIGVNAAGLSEQRTSLENDYRRAYSKSGQLTDATSRAKESGDALAIRMGAQTSTLNQVVIAGAMGLQKVLRSIAVWMGANPEEVTVVPNLEFTESEFNAELLLKLTQAKAGGAPISDETIHNYMREKGLTTKTLQEELGAIGSEEPRI